MWRRQSRYNCQVRHLACFVLLLSLVPPPTALAQDDWSLTRRRPPSGKKTRRAKSPGDANQARGGAGSAVERRELLIRRYTGLLLVDPFQEAAFQRLVSLYRERDGDIEALIKELERRVREECDSFELQVLLGHALRAKGQPARARDAFRSASEMRPGAAEPLLYRARLELEASNPTATRELLRAALDLSRSSNRRRELLQQLGELALDAEDSASASQCFNELGELSGGGLHAASGYARALFARGRYAQAAEQYRALLAEMRGDPRTIAPLLLDLGRTELKAGNAEGAAEVLLRARKKARPGSGILWDIDETLLEACRASERLRVSTGEISQKPTGGDAPPAVGAESENAPRRSCLEQLARALQQEHDRKDPDSLRLLGRVWDELGDIDRAVDAYRRSIRRRPRQLDTRERLIRLLSRDGRLEQALAEYRALVRVAPGEPRYLVELAKLLSDTGRREQALTFLARSGRRFARDPRIHRALYELYSRWGEDERALRELGTLARIEPEETSHLAIMGERLMALGRGEQAVAAWRRILRASPDRAQGHATLGDLYLDHGLELEALHEYREACRLRGDDIVYARSLAQVLEQLNLTEEAVEQWQRVLALAGNDRNARRQARRQLVTIWARKGKLRTRLREYERLFAELERGQAEDRSAALEAGRFMAEAYRFLAGREPGSSAGHRLSAERVLQRVVALDPSDIESLLALERLRTARGDRQGALEVLRQLAEVDAGNARTYYSRMAENALSLYRDDEAEVYAEKALHLNRDDAEAQKRLGDLYLAQQDMANAIASYRRSIELDRTDFATYLKLAELHLSRGDAMQADGLLLEVVRSSPDDDLVARAARSCLQIQLGEGNVESLESVLLPLALANQRRPVFRRLLVELYDALVASLVRTAKGNDPRARQARQRLVSVAKRALRPLLDALWDERGGQRESAVRLLGELAHPNAAGPLLAVVEREGDVGLRRRALIGAGRAADASLAPRFAAVARTEQGLLGGAAAWALARVGGPGAVPAMRELLEKPIPEVRAYAALGLGRARDTASLPRLRRLAREDREQNVRLCALLSLGYLKDAGSVPLLIEALHRGRQQIPFAAALALADIGDRTSVEALAGALFWPGRDTSPAALMGLTLAAGKAQRPPPSERHLPLPGDFPSLGMTLDALAPEASRDPIIEAEPFERFAAPIERAARLALRGPRESVEAALAVLSASGGAGDAAGRGSQLPRARLALRLLPELLRVSRHPDAGIRARALSLLAALEDERTVPAFLAALQDRDRSVQRTALDLLPFAGVEQTQAVSDAVAAIAARHPGWSMRARAVTVLGRLKGAAAERAVVAALGDEYAYVRSAAARALGSIGGPTSVKALAECLANDREGLVRAAAAEALAVSNDPSAAEALQRAGGDPHPAVREALRRLKAGRGPASVSGTRSRPPID